MRAPSTELLLEALAEALQTTAFISPEIAPPDTPAPADVVQLAVRWSGNPAGELQLAAPRPLGALLAANILALEPDAPEALQRAVDALQELCNITTGSLLSRLCNADDAPQMSLPSATLSCDPAAWASFTARPGTVVLLGEGHPVAVRVQEACS